MNVSSNNFRKLKKKCESRIIFKMPLAHYCICYEFEENCKVLYAQYDINIIE